MLLSSHDLPMFHDEAHRALADRLSRDLSPSDPALHDARSVVRRLAELGLLRYLLPGEGGKVDVRALCLVREALAQVSSLADAIFAVQGLGAQPLVRTPSFPDRDAILADVVAGRITLGFALTEPEAGSDVASLETRAVRADGGWALSGEKIFISNVGIADAFVVFARVSPAPPDGKAVSAFFVRADAPGLSLEPIALAGGGDHPLGRLRMDGCKLPERALVGEVGAGMRLALGTLDVFRTSVGAAAAGMARRALDESLAHAKRRVQFGKRLADFQLTQAALAEMATELDASRLLVARAAWEKDHDVPSRTGVAMAKLFATEAAQRIIDRAVQLHGGAGVVEGSVVAELYRDVRPLRIYEGTSEIQRLIIGGALAGAA